MFIFVDKTGADRLTCDKPIRSQKLIFRGERLSTSGVLDVFYDFIHTSLLHKLMPFNGINPNSVVLEHIYTLFTRCYAQSKIKHEGPRK